MDLYLICGQSNSVGYSLITDSEAAYAFAPGLREGYSHVLTCGKARAGGSSDERPLDIRDLPWQKTTLGLGQRTSQYFGPEAGMAAALSKHYHENGPVAGLIKFGHGGVNLLNDLEGNNRFGNWVSPSYAALHGLAYTGATGGLYRGLLDEVRLRLSELPEGSGDIRFRGMYWMQGENDLLKPAEYAEAFAMFVKDLRADLAALLVELYGDDCGTADLPIFVGTVSRTFFSAKPDSMATCRTFIEMQKALPRSIPNCVIVDNSPYDMNILVGGEDQMLGADPYHWSQEAHLHIGYNIGKAILDYYGF